MANTKSTFATLQEVAIKSKVERKGNLDYISWANAWAMLKERFPDAQRTVYEHEHTGLNYFSDGNTAYVKVGITVKGLEHIDYLPVMDFKNKAVNSDSITSTDVNKAIQRSTAKAIAMHGLGIQMWTGEDLPEEKPELQTLKVGSEQWNTVANWANENKELGLDAIVEKIGQKFKITTQIKNEIKKVL